MTAKKIEWTMRQYRASMTDMTECSAWLYDKKKDIPYQVEVKIYDRDNGAAEYSIIIQCRIADDVRAWWMIRTAYADQGKGKDIRKITAKAEEAMYKLSRNTVPITYDEYFDWADNHPIKKHRRVAGDFGVYVIPKDKSVDGGWFDAAYGSIQKTNKYASRYSSEAEAKKVADSLSKQNPRFGFEVRKMGKLDA